MKSKNALNVRLLLCSKFHRYLIIQGHCSLPASQIKDLQIVEAEALHTNASCTAIDSGLCSFELHILRMCDQALSDHCELIITTTEDQQHHILLKPLLDEIHDGTESEKLKQRFNDLLNERSITTMLDLGGRDRSGLDRRQQYPNQNVTVIDIHPGDNVDIVGDAHELTDLLQPQSFGAVISVAVFEHLAMPWKVVLGMNHCLQNNGLGFIVTHQTIGMHDLPWDFWRYSDSAWGSLFNQRTGFRILGRTLSEPVHIIPFHYFDVMADAERSAGFLMSCVLVEKTHTVQGINWPVTMADFDSKEYPLE